MDLLTTLDEIQSEYKSLINTFSVVDENDPITPSKLKELSSYLQNWISNLKNSVATINYEINNDNIQNDELKRYFERDLSLFNKNLQQGLAILTNERKRKNNDYIKELESKKQITEEKIRQFIIDKEIFFITSEQNKLLLSTDFEEDKKRYDYQRSEAKESYHEIVKKYNNILDEKKHNIHSTYIKETEAFKKDNKELLDKLNALIASKTKELSSLNTLLNNERTSMKERTHNESTILNNNIKKISNEKNIQIDKARSQYSKSLSDANIERENKRQTYLSQSQSLLKEFVTKINEIDDTIQKTKDELDSKIYELKRDYFYSVHNYTNDYHNLVEKIKTKYPNNIPRHSNKIIKSKSREYHKAVANLKKTTEKKLYDLTYQYTKAIEQNKNTKLYLELDKNYSIKKLTEQEQYDNKYYQEKSNIYENDTSYVIQNANYRFSQKANVLRCQTQKRYKLLERNFNSIEANYYKKIETVQNKINFHNLEIQLTNQLKDIVSEYQEKNYLNDLHLEQVTNLLEIEKNKLLNQYNEEKYNLNIKAIKQSLDYGYNRINIQNQRQEKLTDLNSLLEKLELEKENLSTSLNIEFNDILNKYDKLQTQLKYNEEQRKSKFEYQYGLYYQDIQTISKINEFYTDLFSRIQTGHQKLVYILFNDTNEEKNINYLISTYNSFFSCFINAYIKILECYQVKINSIIDERIKFIEDFKYNNTYKSLDSNYLKQETNIKEKKNILIDKNDSYKKTIGNFEQKKFTLENDNAMIRASNKSKKKKLDSKSLDIVLLNQTKIKEYSEKINTYKKMIQINDEDLTKQQKKLEYNKINFKKEIEHVKKLQQIDNKNLLLYKKNIAKMICNFVTYAKNINIKSSLSNVSIDNFNKKILESQNVFYSLLAKNKQVISYIHDKFRTRIKLEADYNQAVMKDELNSYMIAYEKQKEKAISKHERTSAIMLNEANQKILTHKNLIDETIKFYENELLKANDSYLKDGIALKNIAKKTNIDFFESYYALNDNYEAIVNHHKKQKELIQNNFDKLKSQSINWSMNQKNTYTSKLESLVKIKNEEIERLPIAYKYNTSLYNKETKKKNQEINEDIKKTKQEFNIERKRIEKQLSILKQQYLQTKLSTEIQEEKAIKAEKKKDKALLIQSLKSIKVSLESK